MKYVVCYSGGYSSATCAVRCVRRYGKENVILLNHNISSLVESEDVKRFKREVADFLGMEITYANRKNWEKATPIKVIKEIGYFHSRSRQVLCTYELKTKPFYDWIEENDPEHENIYMYGFDLDEQSRISKRVANMAKIDCKTDYPMIWKGDFIDEILEAGIQRPNEYLKFKHANCLGCLKAGWQHWYIVYCDARWIYDEVAEFEQEVAHSLHKDSDGTPVFLDDKREFFDEMIAAGIEGTEHVHHRKWWIDVKNKVIANKANIPLEQIDMFAEQDSGVCMECIA